MTKSGSVAVWPNGLTRLVNFRIKLLVAILVISSQSSLMGVFDVLRSEGRVIKAAPIVFFTAVAATTAATGAAIYIGLEKLYQERFEVLQAQLSAAEQKYSDLKDAIPAEVKPLIKITPTSPGYLTTMSNENLRLAAFSLSEEISDFSRLFIERQMEISEDRSASPTDRAKRIIAFNADLDDQFRTKYALNVVNLLKELSERVGYGYRRVDEINDSQIDLGMVLGLSSDLQNLAKALP